MFEIEEGKHKTRNEMIHAGYNTKATIYRENLLKVTQGTLQIPDT